LERERDSSPDSQNSPEPSGLLQVLFASVFAFLWVRAFSKSNNPRMQPVDTDNTQDNANDERHNRQYVPPSPLRVVVERLPPSETPPEERKAEKKRDRRPQWGILLVNVFALVALIAYALTTMKMWHEMQTQTKTAREQLEWSERPWIKIVDVKTRGNNPFIPAFSFQGFGHGPFPTGTKQATFQIEISMKNIGHSMAFVGADFELFFPEWKDTFEDLIVKEEKRFCDHSAQGKVNYPLSKILFPGEPLGWNGAATQLVGPAVSPNTINRGLNDPTGDYVLPVVIICANYNFGASSQKYQTRAMYIVVHKATGDRFFRVGQDAPERELRMIRDELADDAY